MRDMDLDELKELCLQELEGMSKKRIRYILASEWFHQLRSQEFIVINIAYSSLDKVMDESSATDEDEDEDNGDAGLDDLFKPNANKDSENIVKEK